MTIVFIGSGNVATYFAWALYQKQHTIRQIYSPTIENAQKLASMVNAKATDQINEIPTNADVYICAVKDDVLQNITLPENIRNATVIHCSGTQSVNLMQQHTQDLGVIWPLYSVKKEVATSLSNIPLIVDYSTEKAKEITLLLTKDISAYPTLYLDDAKRKIMHLNAVFVNNFTNHLMTIAENLSIQNQLPFEILYPIIQQTFLQVLVQSPASLQTGPAVRGDATTMQSHLDILHDNKYWQAVYKSISESITKG